MKDTDIINVVIEPDDDITDIVNSIDQEFAEHGYPNLYADMSDFYEGLWTIRNKRTKVVIHTYCHDSSIIFVPHNKDSETDNTFIIYFCPKANPTSEEVDRLEESDVGYYEDIQAVSSNMTLFEGMNTPDFFERKVKDWWNKYPVKTEDNSELEQTKCELYSLERIISRLLDDRQNLERKIIQMEESND